MRKKYFWEISGTKRDGTCPVPFTSLVYNVYWLLVLMISKVLCVKNFLKIMFCYYFYITTVGYAAIRPFLYFDPPTLIRPKPYFDFFGQTLLGPKLYFDLYFSSNNKSRFDKRSKYYLMQVLLKVEVKRSK